MTRALLALSLFACHNSGPDTSDTLPPGTTTGGVDLSGYPSGPYLLDFSIAPIGGLEVPFQLDLEPGAKQGEAVFETATLRAWSSASDTLSDVLATATDVPVNADGTFQLDLPQFTLPGAFSPTASDVDLQASLSADQSSPDGLCGTVSGQIVTFGIALDGSTFGAVPWDQRASGAPHACGGTTPTEIPRIETCPTLVDGRNTGFPSGGQSREFEIVLPGDYTPTHEYPLVVVYHGFGGTIDDMLNSGITAWGTSKQVILAIPQGGDLGGTTGFDAFSPPETNLDTVLFDDLVKCAQESFSIDPDRIHVTGMSNGGLETGMLIATRNDVIASAAPMSGGVGLPYEDSGYDMPVLVTWGGETDEAFDQDFNQLALDMISLFKGNGQFVVGCDHGLGHTLDPSFWPWVLEFLVDHPRTLTSEPYANGLPSIYPSYCAIE